MQIISAKSLNADNSVIMLEVATHQHGVVPFTWCANLADAGEDTYGLSSFVGDEITSGRVTVLPFEPPVLQPTPVPLERSEAIRSAMEYLASTDWYVVRRSETGEPIPQDVMDKRAAARAAANV